MSYNGQQLPPPLTVDCTRKQIGGDHYTSMAIQPAEYIHKNGIGFLEGNVIKYVSRYKKKNGIEDLRKALHCLELLMSYESPRASPETRTPTEPGRLSPIPDFTP